MKFQTLIIAIFSVLLTGCTASEAVKIPGGESYTVTVLGDVHYDGKQYHIAPEKTPALQQKRELNINQWLDKSPQLLTAAAKMSRDGVPFIIQLGDIINGGCDNAELQGAAMKDAFVTVKKFFPGKKLFTLCGNHETWRANDAGKAVDSVFVPLMKNELGSDAKTDGANYAVRYGKDLYIFYDYRTKSGDRKKTGAEFTRSVLASNQDARHIFFLTHLPIFPCAKGNPGWIVPEFKELIPLLAKHKAIVLCGHSHFWGHHIYRSGNDKLVQFMITSIGYCWSPGTPLKERFSSYDQWKKEINPRYFTAANQWSTDNLKFFDNADFILYNSQYRIPSGFVRLEVDDSKVTAHIFTDDSGKPVRSVVLKDE